MSKIKEPKPAEFTKQWRHKAENILVLAHVKQQGNKEDQEVGKSWTLLAKGILDLCAEIDRLKVELDKKETIIEQVEALKGEQKSETS